MIVMMHEGRMKGVAKRLRAVSREFGVELKHTKCIDLAARLAGFAHWNAYLERDRNVPLGPLDHLLSEEEFAARDAFQLSVLEGAGLGSLAREILDRVNPTGSWSKQLHEPASAQP